MFLLWKSFKGRCDSHESHLPLFRTIYFPIAPYKPLDRKKKKERKKKKNRSIKRIEKKKNELKKKRKKKKTIL